jgi:5'-nucleotidase
MKLNRRHFIKTLSGTSAAVALGGIPLAAFSKKELIQLTILHTNDVHSHLDPFPENDPKFPGMGGAARKAAIIKKIRNEQENVLLLDAGDILQGSPYFNLYKGELEFKLMSQMGYEGATIGNHEFDNGLKELEKQLPHANFPFICSNYDFTNTPMEGKTIPYKIVDKGGVKVGIFGLGVELAGLVNKKMYGNTAYLDPIEIAAEYAHLLKVEKKCDLVICLSHLGYRYRSKKVCDHVVAKKSKHIDLIIGGHTHTFLNEPLRYKNSDDKEIIICQVGCYGIKLGRLDYFFKKKSAKKSVSGHTIKISNNTSRI